MEGLPFATVKLPEGYKVIFGNTIINPTVFESHEDACAEMGVTDWIPILNACETLFTHMFEASLRNAINLNTKKS